MRRPRGPGGRFLTAEEIAAREAGGEINDPSSSSSQTHSRSNSGSGPPNARFLPPELHPLMQSQPSAPFAPDGPLLDRNDINSIDGLYPSDSNNPDDHLGESRTRGLNEYTGPLSSTGH
jgi:hypothetical protein